MSSDDRKSIAIFLIAVVAVGGLSGVSALSATQPASTATDAASGGADSTQAMPSTSATFNAQKTNGWTVTVEKVVVSQGGFVTIHDASLLEEGKVFESVLGTSVYLKPGTYENLTIELNERLPAGDVSLVAMPHKDTNGNQAYDFVTSQGESDGPYTTDGSPVVDAATVTVDLDCPPVDPTTDPTPKETPEPTETATETATKTEPAQTVTSSPTETAMETATTTPTETPQQTEPGTQTATETATAVRQSPEPTPPAESIEIVSVNAEAETVTIENVGNRVVDLSGWQLDFGDEQDNPDLAVLQEGTELAPGQKLVIGTGDAADGPVDERLGYDGPVLNNREPDPVEIRTDNGEVADTVDPEDT